MDNAYKEAFAEVLEILKNSDENIINKIPKNFINFLDENKDKNYIVKIDFSNENWEDYTKQETQAILALIYRDYIVSPEQRERLLAEENEELIKAEKQLREKYNPDNIFEKHNKPQEEHQNNVSITEYKDPIFKRIINIIKRFFHII